MEQKRTASYGWQDRLKGSQFLELLDDRYLKVREEFQFPRRRRSFGIDVACLSADFRQTNSIPAKSLGGAGAAALVALALGYHALSAGEGAGLVYWFSGAAVAMLVAALLVVTAWRKRLRGYVLQTRLAGVPLLVVQYPRAADGKALEAFLKKLRPCVEHSETGRGLSAEALRSGEVRTLRRLAKQSAIGNEDYERAKQQIFNSA